MPPQSRTAAKADGLCRFTMPDSPVIARCNGGCTGGSFKLASSTATADQPWLLSNKHIKYDYHVSTGWRPFASGCNMRIIGDLVRSIVAAGRHVIPGYVAAAPAR